MYFEINEDSLKQLRSEGLETAKENYRDAHVDELTFDNISWVNPDWNFDEKTGNLTYYGDMIAYGKDGRKVDMGYLSIDVNINMDLAVEVIEYYMKKLGKLKTILEATK